MPQLEHMEAIEKRLWTAADTLRANSNYASNEYFLTQFADQKAHDGGEFFTPVSLVSLIAHVLDAFFTRPIINSGDFLALSRMENRGTANALLRSLVKEDLICVIREASGRRSAIYAFPGLINISEGRAVL